MELSTVGKQIANARKKSGFTQEELAEKIGVSPQAVSKWENGHNLPDIENLMQIAELTNTPYSALLGDEKTDLGKLLIKNRLFREENMFTRMRTTARADHLEETYRALQYMRERHEGQFRKQGRYTADQVQYINHPLLMACQAHAYGVRDDALLAAILLHDVVEDTNVTVEELPFSDEVKKIVSLVSFSVPEGKTKQEAKKEYFEAISKNEKACVVKLIDRCNNVSTMAGCFSRKKMLEYIAETEEYVLPLAGVLKNEYPAYSDLAFLLKYHIVSVLEAIKNLIAG